MEEQKIKIKRTEDGSKTLFVPTLNEHYHSTKGALTEAQHIFIEYGYNTFKQNEIHILEIGFGTGLNAYLTAMEAEKRKIKTHYITLEKYPLTWEEVEKLNYSKASLFESLHTCPWNTSIKINSYFTINKKKTDYTTTIFDLPPHIFNLVYFDAFAPEKQPNMWEEKLFQQLYVIMKPKGRLTSYCVKGEIRRILARCGFEVKRLPGPPYGKKQILGAFKK